MPFQHRIEHASRREIHAAASAQIAALEAQIARQQELLESRQSIITALSHALTRANDRGITRRALQVTFRQARARLADAVHEAIADVTGAARWGLSSLATR